MLTSINPKGQIEAYTDIGQFIGILPPDYPGVSVPKEASDSDQMEDEEVWRSTEEGNHFKFETSTGRITGGFGGKFNGKRIGTSWGGQNSKVRTPKTGEARMNGYWLRGLSESRQVQAINKVVDIKKRMKSSKEYYDDIQRQIEGKEITKKLGQNLLETAGLSDFKPDMTAEEFVMRCRPLKEKKELTDLMAEARGWDENAGKLVEKNLSEDEKKVVEHFAKKYGLINTKGASVLDDRNLSGWDKGDAETWMSLKSKAMGGPDNGREISGLILHESGVKKDWLYDLPNTAWGRARVEREAVRREMEAKAIAKRKIDKDFSNGMITADEREEALKTAGLENFDPDMQPEDYVMKCGTPQRKYNLIDMKGLAMKWYENADKMVQEKWDDQDKKIAEYLADKYGTDGRVLSGLKVPYDYNPKEWEPEDFNCWMDLKSKALGGTTSGKEVPKSILRAIAGNKERSSIVNPWKDSSESVVNLDDVSSYLGKALGRNVDVSTLKNGASASGETLEELEKEAFGRAFGNYQAAKGLKLYLRSKFNTNGGAEAFLNSAGDYLTPEEYDEVKGAIKKAEYYNDVFEWLDYQNETDRIRLSALLNKGMGGADASESVAQRIEEINKEKEVERRKQEEFRKEAERRQREYQEKIDKAREDAERKRKEELARGETSAIQSARASNVKSILPGRNTKEMTHDEIVNKVGGPDLTKGSCVSAAMAYIANKFGFDVRDFRGGSSQHIFSLKSTLIDIAETPGVDGLVLSGSEPGARVAKSEIKTAEEALNAVEIGKEYVISCGRHCSIVRRTENGLEYLELQSSKNGWMPFVRTLGKDTLRHRFGCQKSRTSMGYHFESGAVLVDIEKLRGCKSFENALQYLNTEEGKQRKGAGGYAK